METKTPVPETPSRLPPVRPRMKPAGLWLMIGVLILSIYLLFAH